MQSCDAEEAHQSYRALAAYAMLLRRLSDAEVHVRQAEDHVLDGQTQKHAPAQKQAIRFH